MLRKKKKGGGGQKVRGGGKSKTTELRLSRDTWKMEKVTTVQFF